MVGHTFEISDKEIIHQMKDVFRFEAGDILNIFDGENIETQCSILELHKNNLKLEIIKVFESSEILIQKSKITLAFAILKNDHTELILEKCTELGVTNFIPLITDRTVKTGFRRDRLEKIIKEATEQSGFTRLPQIHEPINILGFLKEKINSNQNNTENLFVLDMDGEKLKDYVKNINLENLNTVILIGPEGGWSDAEREFFRENNLRTFSLAPQTLRAETACISTVSQFLV